MDDLPLAPSVGSSVKELKVKDHSGLTWDLLIYVFL